MCRLTFRSHSMGIFVRILGMIPNLSIFVLFGRALLCIV
jgi:hypothetical protein